MRLHLIFSLLIVLGLVSCVFDRPTPVVPTIRIVTVTSSPTLTPSSILSSSTSTASPTLTPVLTLTPFPTLTPMPDLGMLYVYEAVNGRACPGVVDMCPVLAVFYPGVKIMVRTIMVIEGDDWLAVDHPLGSGEWVWIWAAFNPLKEVQAVEYILYE